MGHWLASLDRCYWCPLGFSSGNWAPHLPAVFQRWVQLQRWAHVLWMFGGPWLCASCSLWILSLHGPNAPVTQDEEACLETEALRGLTIYHLSFGQIRTQIPTPSVYTASVGFVKLLTWTLSWRPWLSVVRLFFLFVCLLPFAFKFVVSFKLIISGFQKSCENFHIPFIRFL